MSRLDFGPKNNKRTLCYYSILQSTLLLYGFIMKVSKIILFPMFFSTFTLHSRIKAQCALIVFGSKIQPGHAYQIPCVYYFWRKNPPCAIIKSRVFIKFGLFSQIFLDFSTNTSQIFLFFMPILSIFPIQSNWLILDILAKIPLCAYSILCVN